MDILAILFVAFLLLAAWSATQASHGDSIEHRTPPLGSLGPYVDEHSSEAGISNDDWWNFPTSSSAHTHWDIGHSLGETSAFDDMFTVNPATGLPMTAGIGSLDVAGNPFGLSSSDAFGTDHFSSPDSFSSSYDSFASSSDCFSCTSSDSFGSDSFGIGGDW